MADVVKTSKVQKVGKDLVKFYKDVRNELKKVIWPTGPQLVNNTISVLAVCVVVGAILWVADYGLGFLDQYLATLPIL